MLRPVLRHIVFSDHSFYPSPRAIGNLDNDEETNSTSGPAALFLPFITTSHAPLYECDYNLHKSNSTYFSDLDVSRHALISCLFRHGIIKLMSDPSAVTTPDGKIAKGPRFMMLQSVQCSFKREIGILERYEVWSRILAWDKKWIYVVSHFVKRGKVKPRAYIFDPTNSSLFARFFRGNRERKEDPKSNHEIDEEHADETCVMDEFPKEAFCASAVARYVAKSGNFTIHPEILLSASGLLPPRPGGWNSKSVPVSKPEEAPTADSREGSERRWTDQKVNEGVDADIWDWQRVEAENARGLKLAANLDALEGSYFEFTGRRGSAISRL